MELRSRSKRLLCLISLPDSSVFEVEVKSLSTGLEILHTVCEKLGIIETDYFGLLHQATGKCGEHIWLNLRNPLSCELAGSPPHRLQLRVKFYIQPHMIQQQASRHQFYLNVREALQRDMIGVNSLAEAVEIMALIVQIDHGDANKMDIDSLKLCYSRVLSAYSTIRGHQDILSLIGAAHLKLHGISTDSAKYQLLQAISKLSSYGLHHYVARFARSSSRIHIAVGPDGILVRDNNLKELHRISFSAIQKLTQDCQTVTIQAVDDSCQSVTYQYRLDARLSACALYRAMTEMYYFYRCDTVGSDVMSQYCRDLKGTLVSLFNENSTFGKSFMFDIERTQTEAYDRVRRMLFVGGVGKQPGCDVEYKPSLAAECCHGDSLDTCRCCQDLKDSVQQLTDCLICQVCADEHINTSFVPCGHTMCCTSCAERLDTCPLCKASITFRLKVFLPWVCPAIDSAHSSNTLQSIACH